MNTTIEKLPQVIVVGAAGGIGKKILTQLKSRAKVIAIVQNYEQRLEVTQFTDQCFECDLSNIESVEKTLFSITENTPSGINGLIFCAAMQPVNPLELHDRRALEQLFSINLFGTLQIIQGLLPKIRETKGRIVLFSSMAGRVAAPMLGGYSASKFALEASADVLRRELAPSGITVSLIEPGGVDTPMAGAQSALVEKLLETLDSIQESNYGRLIRGYGNMAKAALRHASTPEAVARVAVNALLTTSRPKARYLVGIDAKLMILLSRILPTHWLDSLLVRAIIGK